MTKKILIVSSTPNGLGLIRSDKEAKKIKRAHRQSTKKSNFELFFEPAVSFQNFRQDIIDYQPNVLHFICHVSGEKQFCFESDQHSQRIEKIEWFNISNTIIELCAIGHIQMVFVNTCHSKEIAQNLHKIPPYVPTTIGIEGKWEDDCAICLSETFYKHYFEGCTVNECINQSKSELDKHYSNRSSPKVRDTSLYENLSGKKESPKNQIFLFQRHTTMK